MIADDAPRTAAWERWWRDQLDTSPNGPYSFGDAFRAGWDAHEAEASAPVVALREALASVIRYLEIGPRPKFTEGGLPVEAGSWVRVIDVLAAQWLLATTPAPVREASLDVDRLAEAWANVMDGRRVGPGWDGVAARIGRNTMTPDDWKAIIAEYARLASGGPR